MGHVENIMQTQHVWLTKVKYKEKSNKCQKYFPKPFQKKPSETIETRIRNTEGDLQKTVAELLLQRPDR